MPTLTLWATHTGAAYASNSFGRVSRSPRNAGETFTFSGITPSGVGVRSAPTVGEALSPGTGVLSSSGGSPESSEPPPAPPAPPTTALGGPVGRGGPSPHP